MIHSDRLSEITRLEERLPAIGDPATARRLCGVLHDLRRTDAMIFLGESMEASRLEACRTAVTPGPGYDYGPT